MRLLNQQDIRTDRSGGFATLWRILLIGALLLSQYGALSHALAHASRAAMRGVEQLEGASPVEVVRSMVESTTTSPLSAPINDWCAFDGLWLQALAGLCVAVLVFQAEVRVATQNAPLILLWLPQSHCHYRSRGPPPRI